MFEDGRQIDQALHLLGERLQYADAPRTTLLVGGGSALSVSGLIRRTTRDVDVIALIGPERQLVRADPLPAYLQEAIRNVARDLGLPDDWLNAGPASLVDFGLPEGWLDRAVVRDFGPRLRILFAGRIEQIHFKLYAAVDQSGGRHLADLLQLNPTPEELLAAARWTTTHDVSPGFRQMLVQTLRQMGYDDVADQL